MRYLPSITAIITISLLGGVFVASAEGGYTPLVSLGDVTTAGTPVNISSYLSGMLKLLIALGGAISIFMAIVGGTQYVAASINPSAKEDAKNRIINSFIGLALVLSAYLLLNTINPKLVQFNLLLPSISGPATEADVVFSNNGCPTCTDLEPYYFPRKPAGEGCAAPGPCQISSSIAGRLVNLHKELVSRGIGWQVTEMWPPTRDHKAACQNPGPSAGTCVDASLSSSRIPENIKSFIEAASSVGLRAVYEVPTVERFNELNSPGLRAGQGLQYVPGITGEHFSVYSS